MTPRGRWAGETLRVPEHWDEDTVRLWLEQAADTLRRLPDRERPYIYGRVSAWPEIVRSAAEAYGYDDARTRSGPPEASAIDNLGRVIVWFGWLPTNWRRIVWGRACGVPGSKIARRIGCNRATIWRTEKRARTQIAQRLNEAAARPAQDSKRQVSTAAAARAT